MEIYTLKEASRKAKIGIETLKRACEEGLIKATRLANGQWRVAESALSEALHHGLDLRNLTKRAKKKRPQPEGLRFFRGVGGEKLSTKSASGLSWKRVHGCILVIGEFDRPRPGLSSEMEACPVLAPEVVARDEMQRPALCSAWLLEANGHPKKIFIKMISI